MHIAAPVAEMAELAVRSAQAGKHIILGKPMAMNLARGRPHRGGRRAAGVRCLPAQSNTRLRVADLEGRVDRGEIGDIAVIHQTCRWSIAEDWIGSGKPGWFADPAHVPGGAFIDEGIYWVDVFRWLTGSEIVQVEAKMANLVHKDIAVEDWGLAHVHVRQRRDRHARGVVDDQRAAAIGSLAEAEQRRADLEIVGTRGEIIDQWFRSPGRAVLAAGAPDWVFERQPDDVFRPGRSLSTDPPDRRARGRPGDTVDGPGCAHHVRGCDGAPTTPPATGRPVHLQAVSSR